MSKSTKPFVFDQNGKTTVELSHGPFGAPRHVHVERRTDPDTGAVCYIAGSAQSPTPSISCIPAPGAVPVAESRKARARQDPEPDQQDNSPTPR